MKIIGKLKAILGLDDKKYQEGLDKAKKKTTKFGSVLKKVGGLMAGAFAVGAIVRYTRSTIKAVAETKRWADRLGVGVEAMQELNYAAEQFGVNAEAMRDGLKEVTMRVDEFAQTGKGPAAEVMRNLGITRAEAEQLKGNTERLFNTMVDKISQVQNTAERQRIADELFGGTGGEQLVEMIAAGTKELEKFRQEAQDIGYVMSEREVDRMEEADRNMRRLNSAIQGLGRSILTDLGPALKDAIELIEKAVKGLGEFSKGLGSGDKMGQHFIKSLEGTGHRARTVQARIKTLQSRLKALNEEYDKVEYAKVFGQSLVWNEKKAKKLKEAINITTGEIQTLNKWLKKEKQTLAETNKQTDKKVGLIANLEGKIEAWKEARRNAFTVDEIKNYNKKINDAKIRLEALRKIAGEDGAFVKAFQDAEKLASSNMQPFSTENVSPQLKNMNHIISKTKEMQQNFAAGRREGSMFGGVLMRAFEGMQTSITEAMNKSKNVLQGFWSFFKSFIAGLITKLFAAAAAAAVLAFLLNSITGGGSLIGMPQLTGFGDIFKGTFGKMTGFGMKEGGMVPKQYGVDSYPVMASGGEVFMPPKKLDSVLRGAGKKGYIAKTWIEMDKLHIGVQEADRKHNNTV